MITATPQRACAACGKLFFPHSANQTYHSDLCRQRAYRQRSKKRRDPKDLTLSDYFSTYFAQVFQDVSPTTAQALWKGARDDPKRRYAVTSWADIANTTVPFDIDIDIEMKDGICYHNVHFTHSKAMLDWLKENPQTSQKPLVDVIECNPAEYAEKYA